MIYIPKRPELILPVRMTSNYRGFWKLEALNMTDGRRRTLAEFPNLITTNGANMLGQNGVGFLSFCSVGTGNTPPALTDTQLVSRVATTSTKNFTNQGNSGVSPYYGFTQIQFNFAQGTATGNLSEIGVGSGSGGLSLFSRALILDGGGSPTTITVLSTESLYATYQLNQYVPLVDGGGTVVIAGVTYAFTSRAANATGGAWSINPNGDAGCISFTQTFNGSIGSITSSPSGSTGGFQSSIANDSYSTGSFQNTGTSTWNITSGNVSGGISAIELRCGASNGSRGDFQFGISPAIPKDSSHILSLSFANAWTINSP